MEKTKEGDYVPCDLLSIAGSKGAELKGVIEQGTDKGFFLLPLGSSDIGGKRTFDLKLEQGNPLCFGDGTEIFFESQQGYALVK